MNTAPENLRARLTALYRGFNTSYTDAEKSYIEEAYGEVTGRAFRSCRCQDRYRDAVIEMRIQLKNNTKMKTKSNYKLVPGVIIQPQGTSTVYTNDNLTDEVAAAFLTERPNAVALFEVIPAPQEGDDGDVPDELNDTPAPQEGDDVMSAKIMEIVSAKIAEGKSKAATKMLLTGQIVDGVKLTKNIIGQYIKAIEAQGNK